MVSHDRYFLNRMVTKDRGTVPAEIAFYTGNYDLLRNGKSIRDRYTAEGL